MLAAAITVTSMCRLDLISPRQLYRFLFHQQSVSVAVFLQSYSLLIPRLFHVGRSERVGCFRFPVCAFCWAARTPVCVSWLLGSLFSVNCLFIAWSSLCLCLCGARRLFLTDVSIVYTHTHLYYDYEALSLLGM